jgi:hypothetical protein
MNGAHAAGAVAQGGSADTRTLADDLVKLIAYFVVSVKPDAERLMPRGADTIVVTDNLSDEAFTAYVIARYFQSTAYTELSAADKVKVEAERIYLRVHFNVVRRWPREPRKYEQRQIAVLDEIGRALSDRGRVEP